MTLHKPKIVPFSHFFLIQGLAGPDDPHSYFLNAVQHIVDTIIPESLWLEIKSTPDAETLFGRLESSLPIFKCAEDSDCLILTYLCPYIPRIRRYVIDALSQRQPVEIAGGISLHFQFVMDPARSFFIAQEIISFKNDEERAALLQALPELISDLKQKFPRELPRPSEIHPTFMPRNEEEMIRNLIVLARQIRYVRDLPQVSLHYDKQTDTHLTFTILIARLLKGNFEPLRKTLEKSRLKIEIDDIRIMGYLKQKYPKEAAVLRISVDKKPFFRPDFSLDLLRARRKIVSELHTCLGDLRDFNGGMLRKQEEALHQLRQELGPLSPEKEFLLEHYFYSLKPAVMQTAHETTLLKSHFGLLTSLDQHSIQTQTTDKFFLCFLTASAITQEALRQAIAPLQIPASDLTTSFLLIKERAAIGFILRLTSPETLAQFEKVVIDCCL